MPASRHMPIARAARTAQTTRRRRIVVSSAQKIAPAHAIVLIRAGYWSQATIGPPSIVATPASVARPPERAGGAGGGRARGRRGGGGGGGGGAGGGRRPAGAAPRPPPCARPAPTIAAGQHIRWRGGVVRGFSLRSRPANPDRL